MIPPPTIAPLGEDAVTLAWGDRVDAATNRLVHAAATTIRAAGLPAVVELIPAYAALTVVYDPLHTDYGVMAESLAGILVHAVAGDFAAPGGEHVVPVRYDGPDLADVARRTGLTRAEVIRRHAAPWYRVYLLGFVPGFAYLGDLDPSLLLPRRAEPRRSVPAGSVAIAGAQTAVYPLDTPGGWHLIGSTAVAVFTPTADSPALFRPGDRVRFEPVDGC